MPKESKKLDEVAEAAAQLFYDRSFGDDQWQKGWIEAMFDRIPDLDDEEAVDMAIEAMSVVEVTVSMFLFNRFEVVVRIKKGKSNEKT